MNLPYDNLSDRQKKSIDSIVRKLAYFFYFIPSLMLYSFAYDMTHEVAHWSTRNFQYEKDPLRHFLATFISFIFITSIIWAGKRSINSKIKRSKELIKIILKGILIMIAYLPLIYLMNRSINPW